MQPFCGFFTFSLIGVPMALAASSCVMLPTSAIRRSTMLRRLVASSTSLTGS